MNDIGQTQQQACPLQHFIGWHITRYVISPRQTEQKSQTNNEKSGTKIEQFENKVS